MRNIVLGVVVGECIGIFVPGVIFHEPFRVLVSAAIVGAIVGVLYPLARRGANRGR